MKSSNVLGKSQSFEQVKCFVIFFTILSPIVYCITERSKLVGHFLPYALFLIGWFVWTFAEYILHRFWNHAKGVNKNNSIVQRHHHHHTHPTDISVSAMQRMLMILLAGFLITMSFLINRYLMIIAGIETGIFWFFMMHYFLHQRWAKKVFPRLVRYHVIHHCKEPDTCYGISTGWWDRLFGTTPQKNRVISEKVLTFYFHKGQKSHRNGISSFLDEKLSEVSKTSSLA